jgi:predicted nucleic acid-binding protein
VPGYVLDTSALLAMLRAEPGAEQVLEILGSGVGGEVHEPMAPYGSRVSGEAHRPPVYLPFVALMELEDRAERLWGRYRADYLSALVQAWPVELVESSPLWRRQAAAVKASHRLSLVDAWICSLALLQRAKLVHRDPEYDAVRGLETVRLPAM